MWHELVNQQDHWNFIISQSPRSGIFLQTPAWLEYQNRLGNYTKVLGYFKTDKLLGVCSLVKIVLPVNFFYYFSPKGPIFQENMSAEGKLAALSDLRDYLKPSGALFFRLEPQIKPAGALKIKDVNPRATTIIDLKPDFKDILLIMHEKTRYNIRLAERKGLKFRWSVSNQDFESFWKLIQATAYREGFKTHSKEHYKIMLEVFGREPLSTLKIACRLALVELGNELLAASLVLVANKQATYLHGASSRNHKDLMAPYLLHSEAMRLLKEANCLTYDMWGVQPKDGSLPEWAGFSRFKLGWGGKYTEELGTFDYPLQKPLYLIYKIARRLHL